MRRREEEFERVAMPHTGALLRFAQRLGHNPSNGEDLVQETLMLAWRGFHQLEPGTNARAWLFRILVNVFNGQSRKEHHTLPALELTTIPSATDPQFDSVEVIQALDRLGSDQRAVLMLALVEGFTCREIAEILMIPIGTVMSRLSRAREAMRDALAPRSVRQNEKVAP